MSIAVDHEKIINNRKQMSQADLYVFQDTADYLCYVEGVHLLMHEGIKKECTFLKKKSEAAEDEDIDSEIEKGVVRFKIGNATLSADFLTKQQRVKEFFFVIDNTGYADAIISGAYQPHDPADRSKDIYMKTSFKYSYTSNDKYFVWTFFFMIILISLGVILLISIALYCRMNYVYNRYAKERKVLK